MKYVLTLLCLLLVGCGRDEEHHAVVDAKLRDLVGRTQELLQVDLSGISVTFASLDKNTLALCTIEGKYREVKVNSSTWDTLSSNTKLEVMLHEMGHCALFKGHVTTKLDDGCPSSLMSPNNFSNEECFTTHFDYYITELREK